MGCPRTAALSDDPVRALGLRDYPALFYSALPEDEWALPKGRRRLAAQGVGQAFVAVTERDHPCYVQWLLIPADNERLRRHFRGIIPLSAPDDAHGSKVHTRRRTTSARGSFLPL